MTEWTAGADCHPLTTARVTDGFRRPLPTVRHGCNFDVGIFNYIANSERDVFRNLLCAERTLELVRCDKEFHQGRLRSYKVNSRPTRPPLQHCPALTPQLALQNLARQPRVGLSFRQLHYLALEKI